jgi:hypothetical protein
VAALPARKASGLTSALLGMNSRTYAQLQLLPLELQIEANLEKNPTPHPHRHQDGQEKELKSPNRHDSERVYSGSFRQIRIPLASSTMDESQKNTPATSRRCPRAARGVSDTTAQGQTPKRQPAS